MNERIETIQAIDAYFHEQYAIPQSGCSQRSHKALYEASG